jgi:hypothetical protein
MGAPDEILFSSMLSRIITLAAEILKLVFSGVPLLGQRPYMSELLVSW